MHPLRLAGRAALFLLAAPLPSHAADAGFYQTKTPYAPQQDAESYEPAPAGFAPVYTELVARHGARGLTGFKADLALYNLWRMAADEDALTPLGRDLGPDIEAMMRANASIGYGNETLLGVREHTQLAQRLYDRLPGLFRAATAGGRRIVVVTSGKDRAVDSGAFFAQALVQRQPSLAPLVDGGTDRARLYFHKLNVKDDGIVPAASLAYQRWAKSPELARRAAAIRNAPALHAAAEATLSRLFTLGFIAALDAGRHVAVNSGTRRYPGADGKTATLTGDGKTKVANVTDAALALYELYAAGADMPDELRADFTRYVPGAQAHVFAEAEDAVAFHEKGPGSVEQGDVTWRMAAPLLDDFFAEADAIAAGDRAHAAKLRFTHAEIVIPFAAALGLAGMSEQLPRDATFDYGNSPWRGARVAPMAANIQWDLFQDAGGRTLVRMLYDERETDFKAACADAKIAPASHYYDYARLRACYR